MREHADGYTELRLNMRRNRPLFWSVALFSAFVNLLMLTGPLYMLQVYDGVLTSRSIETLVALSLLVLFLYIMMGLLDFARGRVLARAGARFQTDLSPRVFYAALARAEQTPGEPPASGLRDLDRMQKLIGSTVCGAAYDLPWTPIFLSGIWVFHPMLGALALGGGALLIALAIINRRISKEPTDEASRLGYRADTMATRIGADAGMVGALGLRDAMLKRWRKVQGEALQQSLGAADVSGTFLSATKALRLMLQSAMLGMGAYLVLQGLLSPGAMIAGSILLGRALAPVEQITGQWPVIQSTFKSWHDLAMLLASQPQKSEPTPLPRPPARLELRGINVRAPGTNMAILSNVSFKLEPGQALGVIGASGAGKSTLAKVVTGGVQPLTGEVRLGGAMLQQYARSDLGNYIGYLPQRVQLFDGTISENIARLSEEPDADAVVRAARMADAHDMIVELADGYDTPIQGVGDQLSGGQVQRIGLARAMYGGPVLLVLDEPNSNLDNDGSEAVNAAVRAIKAAGNSVLVIAHRPAAIKECDILLALDKGRVRAFGPKNKVLREVLQNSAAVEGAGEKGGVQ